MSEIFNAIAGGFGGMLGWGVADPASAKGLEDGYSPAQVGLVTYIITAICLLFAFSVSERETINISVETFVALFLFALINYIVYKFFYQSLKYVAVGVASTIFSTYAVFTIPISVLVFSESMPPSRLLVLLFIVLGVVRLIWHSFENENAHQKGITFALLAAITLGCMFPFWDAILQVGDAIFLVLVVDSMLAVIFLIDVVIEHGNFRSITTPMKNRALIMAGIANVLAVYTTTWGFEVTNLTSVIVVVSSAAPLIAALLGHYFLGEKHRLKAEQWQSIFAIIIATIALSLT